MSVLFIIECVILLALIVLGGAVVAAFDIDAVAAVVVFVYMIVVFLSLLF